MKNAMHLLPALFMLTTSFISCKKEAGSKNESQNETGFVTGKITDSKGNIISGAKITIEHTVWYDSYLNATADANGNYKIAIPSEPAGDWTAHPNERVSSVPRSARPRTANARPRRGRLAAQ